MSEVIDIQSEGFKELVEKSEIPVVVEYWHHKCPACLKMKPIYEKMPQVFNGRAKITRINLLESKENRVLAINQGVRGTPTFKIFCSGREVGEVIGIRTEKELVEEFERVIKYKDACLMSTPLEE
jgi:thioredoxin-like negative regulator of GroEL